MPKKKKSVKSLVIPKLREASRWWWAKSAARDLAKEKVQIGVFKNGNPKYKTLFKCNSCGELFERGDTHMDHINPVIDVDSGFVDWNTYIERLFVDVEGWQLLCAGCHEIKTALEKELRQDAKKKKKT
jgi:5-methylcytosine-specific restriction endonuclease McrA